MEILSQIKLNGTAGTLDQVISSNAGTILPSWKTLAGGGGITRSIISITTATTGGSAVNTDYVYLTTGTITFTLPTAIGNTNRYTIVHKDALTLTIATTLGQTIAFYPAAPDTTATITIQGTVIEFFSDGANWWTI